jgi:ankyrin repeat protein
VLFMSIDSGDMELTQKFLAKGAEINVRADHGRTPLMAAAAKGSMDAVKLLIDKGAEVDAKMENGQNAWSLAHSGSHAQVEAYLAKRTKRQDIENLLRKDDWTEAAIKRYFDRLTAAPAPTAPRRTTPAPR